MKKLFYISAIIVLLIHNVNGQGNLILSTGSKLVVIPSTYLVSTGSITIQSTATLTNNGSVSLKGDFTNNGTSAVGTGLLAFNGTVAQIIGGSTSTGFGQVNVSNNIQLNTSATVNTVLTFQSGKLTLGSSNLTMGNSGSISGYDNSKYINAGGSGRLIQNVAAVK